MSDHCDTNKQAGNSVRPESADTTRSEASTVAVSVCFWCVLLTSTVIYGLVALAPKLAVWQEVRSEYLQNTRQMVTLEEDVEYLKRVDEALSTDPEFLKRLVGLNRNDQESELIPVSGSLLFGQADDPQLPETTSTQKSFLVTATHRIARNGPLRNSMLLLSAALTMFAFAFLNDAGAGFVQTIGQLMRRVMLFPVARYRRTHDPETNDSSAPTARTPQSDTQSPSATP